MPKRKLTKKNATTKRQRRLIISTEARKRIIYSTLQELIASATPEQRLELVEHVVDIGIVFIGDVTGLDTTEAVVLVPEDPLALLLRNISLHSELKQIPYDDVCSALTETLDLPPASPPN